MEAKNVDDILVREMQNQPATTPAAPSTPPTTEPEHAPESPSLASVPQDQGVQAETPPEVPHGTVEQKLPEKPEISGQNQNVDEYGQPIAPPRTYTEEEVQQMIRERVSRGRIDQRQPPQQPTPQQPRPADAEQSASGDQDWEKQLDHIIDKRIETRQAEQREAEWRQQEAQRQAHFQEKFESGMAKYGDFEQVVQKVAPSISPSMMLATRSLNDPAAFLYGAAKMHPAELERISKIADGAAQAMEIGRLHERMVKYRVNITGAPKPLEVPKSDVPNKPLHPERSLDQRIHDYAKQKRR